MLLHPLFGVPIISVHSFSGNGKSRPSLFSVVIKGYTLFQCDPVEEDVAFQRHPLSASRAHNL